MKCVKRVGSDNPVKMLNLKIKDRLYVSESYLFRLFKRELHQTPLKYIREKRLMMAKKMLSEGERPTAVCSRCGFSDYTTFYRNYVAFFGYPPSEREREGPKGSRREG